MNLTEEQKKILDCNNDACIEARAGTGKTTTLIEYSLRNEKAKKIYLAFNKGISEEAKSKFNAKGVKNITISTAHGLAYKSIIIGKQYKLGYNLSTYHLSKYLKTTGTGVANKLVAHSIKKVELFCNSADMDINTLNYEDCLSSERAISFYREHKAKIDEYSNTIWKDIVAKKIDSTHSSYLKMYQLTKPVLNYDIILCDEAQDLNPVILDIFFNQKGRKIMVGDNHQAIYSWRGAINALKLAPESYERFTLTESFRFPQSVANLGLEVLSFKEGKEDGFDFSKLRLLGKGQHSKIETKAIISRSNIALLEKLFTQKMVYKKPYIEGGLDGLLQTNSGVSLLDIYYLKKGEKDKIQNFFIKTFRSLGELQEYYEDIDDQSINSFVNFLTKFENTLLIELDQLKKRISDSKEYCDYTFSTIHKAKGNEWDQVQILSPDMFEEGFPNKVPESISKKGKDGKVISIELTDEERDYKRKQWVEELNIYYVAVTRAKVNLIHNIPWLSEFELNTNNNNESEINKNNDDFFNDDVDTTISRQIKVDNNIITVSKENNTVWFEITDENGRRKTLPRLEQEDLFSLLKELFPDKIQ